MAPFNRYRTLDVIRGVVAARAEDRITLYTGNDDHIVLEPERARRDWRDMRSLIETVWGYAITCHKAQGSQWDDVVLFDESWAFRDTRERWLYTAVTRAQKEVTLIGDIRTLSDALQKEFSKSRNTDMQQKLCFSMNQYRQDS